MCVAELYIYYTNSERGEDTLPAGCWVSLSLSSALKRFRDHKSKRIPQELESKTQASAVLCLYTPLIYIYRISLQPVYICIYLRKKNLFFFFTIMGNTLSLPLQSFSSPECYFTPKCAHAQQYNTIGICDSFSILYNAKEKNLFFFIENYYGCCYY